MPQKSVLIWRLNYGFVWIVRGFTVSTALAKQFLFISVGFSLHETTHFAELIIEWLLDNNNMKKIIHIFQLPWQSVLENFLLELEVKSNSCYSYINVSLCLSHPCAGRLAHSCHIPYATSRHLLPNAMAGLLELSLEFSTCFMTLPLRKEMAEVTAVSKTPKNPPETLAGMSNLCTHLDCITGGYSTISAAFSSFREIHFLGFWRNTLRKRDLCFFKNFLLTAFFLLLFPVYPFP